MIIRHKVAYLAAVALLASGCASSRGPEPADLAADQISTEVSRDVEIQIKNEWSTVARVSLLVGGQETSLGRVQPSETGMFRVAAGPLGGNIRLVAHPNAVFSTTGSYLSVPFSVSPGDQVQWRLEASPGRAGNLGLTTALRIVRCVDEANC